MQNTLTFDIETIPQQTIITTYQKEAIEKQTLAIAKRDGWDPLIIPDDEIKKIREMVMATNPYFGEIICIGMHHNMGAGSSIALTGSEESILQNFWDKIKSFNGTFVSFNGLEFDVPFIIKRSMKHKILPTNNNFLDQRRYSKWPHFDVKAILGNWNTFMGGSLKLVCEIYGIASPKEGEVHADNVYAAYKNNNINEIAEYCKRDIIATYELYKLLNKYTYSKT